MSGDGGSGDGNNIDVLREACGEARQTLDTQITWIHEIDKKSVRILRANLVITGLVITAVSLSFQFQSVNLGPYINFHTVGAATFLILSTILAAITFLASHMHTGIGQEDLVEILHEVYDQDQFYDKLCRGYADWIKYNEHMMGLNSIIMTATICAAINALVLFVTGLIAASVNIAGTDLSHGILYGLIVVLLVMNIGLFKMKSVVIWWLDVSEDHFPLLSRE